VRRTRACWLALSLPLLIAAGANPPADDGADGAEGVEAAEVTEQADTTEEAEAAAGTATVESPTVLTWDDLLPEGWTPPVTSVDHFFDSPPQPAQTPDDAPVVDALDAQRVRLPGYLVPITLEGERVREFLMVPYFGACIHVPPPPPNQIVFVSLPQAIDLDDPYGAHWVTGVLSTSISSTELADAAYTMRGEAVDPFNWQQPPVASSDGPASR